MEENRVITKEQIDRYVIWLKEEEKAKNTIDKYRRDIRKLMRWLDGRPADRVTVNGWKASLLKAYLPSSVNSMLASANGFFGWMGWKELELKYEKIQQKLFCDKDKELEKSDYNKLIAAANRLEKFRLALLMETLCALGLRVSELKFITVEAVNSGRAVIRMKGKVRTVIISGKLSRKLAKYAKKHKIRSGEIFITRNGRSLSRSQIWQEMKKLCKEAGVEPSKVFPHNLRHLFARSFYSVHKDIVKLADVLGHSSIQTTRIYLISTGEEHARQMEMLGLVS